nr:hypothetical protein [Tanacetum cinerariifolium]
MNSKGFFFLKFDSIKGLEDVLESGPWMIRNSLIILKKWTMNTSPYKEELTFISVWVKIHDVPLQVFSNDGISLIASQIANEALKDSITMGIFFPEDMGFTKETIRVEYKWKPPCCEQFLRRREVFSILHASLISTLGPYDALDDMKGDEEVEVVFDETANFLDSNIIKANYTAPDASKT